MIFLEKDNYRVSTISTIKRKIGEEPVSKGLAVERATYPSPSPSSSPSWYVLTYIRYDCKNNSSFIDPVGTRLLDVPAMDWDLVKKMIGVAIDIVSIANTGDVEE